MRYVALALAVAVIGAGLGFVSLGTALAHGGNGTWSGGADNPTVSGCVSLPVLTDDSTFPCDFSRERGKP